MARPRRPWFRWYVEAMHDRKLRRIPPAQRWVWLAVLATARTSPVSGYLMVSDTSAATEDDLADVAAVPKSQVRQAMDYFAREGMIRWDPDVAANFVPAWFDRQFESDDVTQRTRKHRSNGD